jgi:hypothetical protein
MVCTTCTTLLLLLLLLLRGYLQCVSAKIARRLERSTRIARNVACCCQAQVQAHQQQQ